jgi:hypothetical protein
MEEHEARDLLHRHKVEVSFDEFRSYAEIAAALGLVSLVDKTTTITVPVEGILESNE